MTVRQLFNQYAVLTHEVHAPGIGVNNYCVYLYRKL